MAKQNKRPMMLKIGDSTFDKIQAFYIDPEKYPLSETHEAIRKRWITVMNLQLKAYSKVQIATMLEREHGICQAQAYIDIRNAENVFGNITKTDTEAFKAMWIEWTKDFLKRSRQSGDKKAEGKALDMLAKYGDLDADKLEFNPEKLKALEIQTLLQPKLLAILKEYLTKGVVDFNNMNVTDIDHEEIN